MNTSIIPETVPNWINAKQTGAASQATFDNLSPHNSQTLSRAARSGAEDIQHNEISETELFGPITYLYRVRDFAEALRLANDSPYGLTACIHTRNIHRATEFTHKVLAGVAVVNAGTYGSEPHMPFGGLKQSGNGWREPGTEALDVYSDLKNILINVDPDLL